MKHLSIEEFRERAEAFDSAVSQTPDVDVFCSTTAWTLSAWEAFHNRYRPWIRESGDGSYIAMLRGNLPPLGNYLTPMESMWGLACPFIGADITDHVPRIVDAFAEDEDNWEILLLSGLPLDSPLLRKLVHALSKRYRVRGTTTALRYTADLEGGLDGWLERRTSKFRNNMRRAMRRNDERGVTFERVELTDAADAMSFFERAMRIEARSWKGRSGCGVNVGPMRLFTRSVLLRSSMHEGARGVIARLDGRDVGFIYGGVLDGTYRGLQMSFDDSLSKLSTGNALQYRMLEWLCEDGYRTYDLGSDLPYKRYWGSEGLKSVTIVASKR